jgi:hypothetical protein
VAVQQLGRGSIVNIRGRSDSIPADYADLGDRAGLTSGPRLSRADRRLERDRIRGYSINVKQVVLAFAIEFVIIALILVSQFIYAAQVPSATEYKVISALLFPIALAMIELARVPLAIAVRTQDSLRIKFAALLGVVCAVAVTSTSLSNIGNLTFNPRLEDAQGKRDRLIEAQDRRKVYLSQMGLQQSLLDQKIKDRTQLEESYQKVVAQFNAQPAQDCSVLTSSTTTPEGSTQRVDQKKCVPNPALKPLQNELAGTKQKLSDADTALKQEQGALSKYNRQPFDEAVSKAEGDYRAAIYQSQLHSYTAMIFRKDPQEVSDGEIKTLEGYLIWIPSIAAALSSTLIAMTAVHRRRPTPDAVTAIPDEAAAYLFGPLVDAIRREASDAVAAAVHRRAETAPLGNTS